MSRPVGFGITGAACCAFAVVEELTLAMRVMTINAKTSDRGIMSTLREVTLAFCLRCRQDTTRRRSVLATPSGGDVKMRWTLVTATMLVSLVALAAAQPAPVVIGLLLANTGFMSVIGQDATRGFELYLEKVSYRAGGRELKVVKADTESKVDVGLMKIQSL